MKARLDELGLAGDESPMMAMQFDMILLPFSGEEGGEAPGGGTGRRGAALAGRVSESEEDATRRFALTSAPPPALPALPPLEPLEREAAYESDLEEAYYGEGGLGELGGAGRGGAPTLKKKRDLLDGINTMLTRSPSLSLASPNDLFGKLKTKGSQAARSARRSTSTLGNILGSAKKKKRRRKKRAGEAAAAADADEGGEGPPPASPRRRRAAVTDFSDDDDDDGEESVDELSDFDDDSDNDDGDEDDDDDAVEAHEDML